MRGRAAGRDLRHSVRTERWNLGSWSPPLLSLNLPLYLVSGPRFLCLSLSLVLTILNPCICVALARHASFLLGLIMREKKDKRGASDAIMPTWNGEERRERETGKREETETDISAHTAVVGKRRNYVTEALEQMLTEVKENEVMRARVPCVAQISF